MGFILGEFMNLDRFESLIGTRKLNDIKKLKIVIVGIGGVGGYTLLSLVRSGVENITIIDKDKIDITNLNRQIITDSENIGLFKVDEGVKYAKKINPHINIVAIKEFISEDNVSMLKGYDYIIDACDTVSAKISIIKFAISNNIKVISCMGTAKKIDATKLCVSYLDKTTYCPLAKKIRRELTKDEQKKVKVIYSEEIINKSSEILGSTSYVPGVAGLLITGEVIKDMVRE